LPPRQGWVGNFRLPQLGIIGLPMTDVDRNPLCQRAAELQQRARDRHGPEAQETSSAGQIPIGEPAAQSQNQPNQDKPFAYLRSVIGG
ncbi:MAG: hypothetical protein K2Y51_23440, partial [Gammaproteobacteria bacterium]|nr:hypothetical protein [Gammaproteobacteria bacterium]